MPKSRPTNTFIAVDCLAGLAWLLSGCLWSSANAVPEVKFTTPAEEITSFSRIPYESKDHFGAAIDIEGNLVAVGAPAWGHPAFGAGSVHIYRRTSSGEWVPEADLAASDRDDGFQFDQHFGEAVAFSGDVLAIGAPGTDDREAGDNTGAVYVFQEEVSGWAETAVLKPEQKRSGARMGSSVSFDGDLLVISGSPLSGQIATFGRNQDGWIEFDPLVLQADPTGDPVNIQIDLKGKTLVVSGAPYREETAGENETEYIQSLARKSSVTLYELDGFAWKEAFRLPSQEAALFRVRDDAPFGMSVALGGDAERPNLLAVGKPGFTGSTLERGSVLIYRRGLLGWQLQAEISLDSDPSVPGSLPFFGDQPGAVFFGAHVNLEGNRLAVVSMFANTAYIFDLDSGRWVYRWRITPGLDYYDDFMRRITCMEGDSLIYGSPGDLGGGNVLAFTLEE